MATPLEQMARRAARRVGLIAKKSRWRQGTADNLGHFMLVEPYRNVIVAENRFDMTAEEVIERCDDGGAG